MPPAATPAILPATLQAKRKSSALILQHQATFNAALKVAVADQEFLQHVARRCAQRASWRVRFAFLGRYVQKILQVRVMVRLHANGVNRLFIDGFSLEVELFDLTCGAIIRDSLMPFESW